MELFTLFKSSFVINELMTRFDCHKAVYPTSYKMGTRGSFLGVKRQGREADHSPPTSAEVKKMWIYTSTLTYVFMA
jgi:hypothetical protein